MKLICVAKKKPTKDTFMFEYENELFPLTKLEQILDYLGFATFEIKHKFASTIENLMQIEEFIVPRMFVEKVDILKVDKIGLNMEFVGLFNKEQLAYLIEKWNGKVLIGDWMIKDLKNLLK